MQFFTASLKHTCLPAGSLPNFDVSHHLEVNGNSGTSKHLYPPGDRTLATHIHRENNDHLATAAYESHLIVWGSYSASAGNKILYDIIDFAECKLDN